MSKLKVGNRVVTLTDMGNLTKKGEFGTIIEVDDDSCPYYVKMDKGNQTWWLTEDDVELIQTELDLKLETAEDFLAIYIKIGNITIALPKGTPVGVAFKNPEDENCDTVGASIALMRMLNNAHEKGLM